MGTHLQLAKMEHEETRTHRRSFLKLSISSFLFFSLSLFLARIALHALYTRKANLLEKKKKYTILVLMGYMGTIRHYLAILEHKGKGTQRRSFLKLSITSFLFFLCFWFLGFVVILASISLWVCTIFSSCSSLAKSCHTLPIMRCQSGQEPITKWFYPPFYQN